jgi:RNA polymerase sigma-70 factor, ECF subfamily
MDYDGTIMTSTQLDTFNEHRPLLFGIAWRMLGNVADAEDTLQDALIRWQRTDESSVRSPRAFLVTMVTRLCLNHLDLARVKKERLFAMDATMESIPTGETNPAEDADLADALDSAFSVVLKCLSPMERAVFLLREVFECDYAEVARIVEKSEDNCRQILGRARERVAGRDPRFEVTLDQQETVLREFLSATESGDLDRLAHALAADATLISDGENLGANPPPPITGLAAVAQSLLNKTRAWISSGANVQQTSFGQVPLLLAYRDGKLLNALAFVLRAGQARTIYSITCPVRLRSLSVQCPPSSGHQSNS